MKTIETEKIPIWLWAEYMEDGAKAQAMHLALHPYTVHHVAMMADCHQGYGMPIGGVIGCRNVVIPGAVGLDIGCGMRAIRTNLPHISREDLIKLVEYIKANVPVGFAHSKDINAIPLYKGYGAMNVVPQEYDSAMHQVGTLGGGNHFIEVQWGDDGHIWIMIHSGSRNLGKKVAEYYIKEATKYGKDADVQINPSWELDYLPVTSEYGREYINEMMYCLDFAKANRELMMQKAIEGLKSIIPDVKAMTEFDVHHNYARQEEMYGQMMWIHRKGATSAYRDQIGVIPGSQGTSSYIVKGRGNEQSFKSCSHGAGRTMGRGEAKRTLDLKKEIEILDALGIIHDMRSVDKLDEASSAYKDITEVMANQVDLVGSLVKLTPLAVIKG
jgi:tRNA-splicing ligase RtcB